MARIVGFPRANTELPRQFTPDDARLEDRRRRKSTVCFLFNSGIPDKAKAMNPKCMRAG
jgi:hypothetical protein